MTLISDSLHKLLDDATVEMTKYRIKMSFLSVIVLHEDPTPTISDGIDPTITSWQKLHKASEKYFGLIAGISTTGASGQDLINIRQQLSKACGSDHLR